MAPKPMTACALALLFGIALLPLRAVAAPAGDPPVLSARKLASYCTSTNGDQPDFVLQSICMGYIEGAAETLSFLTQQPSVGGLPPLCANPAVSNDSLRLRFAAYVVEHKDLAEGAASGAVILMLLETYQCRPKEDGSR